MIPSISKFTDYLSPTEERRVWNGFARLDGPALLIPHHCNIVILDDSK